MLVGNMLIQFDDRPVLVNLRALPANKIVENIIVVRYGKTLCNRLRNTTQPWKAARNHIVRKWITYWITLPIRPHNRVHRKWIVDLTRIHRPPFRIKNRRIIHHELRSKDRRKIPIAEWCGQCRKSGVVCTWAIFEFGKIHEEKGLVSSVV